MNPKTLRIGIVGAGLIGGKRALAIKHTGKGILAAVADVNQKSAEALAAKYGASAETDWKKLIARKDIDVVVVAVPNAFTKKIVIAALRHGKHVLSEKPFGINAKEAKAMAEAARKSRCVAKAGFNHRFQAAMLKAHEIYKEGGIGKIFIIRARYGHGGRPGMEKEWRFNKKLSGGGELLDQGVHLIDLARWFGGEPTTVYGLAQTKFWRTKLEDNVFVLMRNNTVTVSFHVSTTNWKNLFSFEIFGDKGYLRIDGKGGSYGEEVLTWGRRRPGAAPDTKVFKFPGSDESWEREWKNFTGAIAGRNKVIGDAMDGLRTNQIVEALYRSSREHKEIKVKLT
ncbi:MAG: Gfo/Idh/MocA family oxidoreductase [Minisyncoccia bacterium]